MKNPCCLRICPQQVSYHREIMLHLFFLDQPRKCTVLPQLLRKLIRNRANDSFPDHHSISTERCNVAKTEVYFQCK